MSDAISISWIRLYIEELVTGSTEGETTPPAE